MTESKITPAKVLRLVLRLGRNSLLKYNCPPRLQLLRMQNFKGIAVSIHIIIYRQILATFPSACKKKVKTFLALYHLLFLEKKRRPKIRHNVSCPSQLDPKVQFIRHLDDVINAFNIYVRFVHSNPPPFH